MTGKPTTEHLLARDGAFLSRSHLRDLGWGRSQIDRIFGLLDVIVIDGTRTPMIRRDDYLMLLARSMYGDNRVRP